VGWAKKKKKERVKEWENKRKLGKGKKNWTYNLCCGEIMALLLHT
jgi:hypothetical protein